MPNVLAAVQLPLSLVQKGRNAQSHLSNTQK